MAELTAFFDESGDMTGSNLLVLAGYLFVNERKPRVEAEWTSALQQANVPYFHMVECAPEHGRGAFADVSRARRELLTRQLIHSIGRHAEFGLAVVTNPKKMPSSDHYAGLMERAVCLMMDAARQIDPDLTSIDFVFEAGHSSQARARSAFAKMVQQHGFNFPAPISLRFSTKAGEMLIQSADLLAWHVGKYSKEVAKRGRPIRKDYIELLKNPQHAVVYFDASDNLNNTFFDQDPLSVNPTRDPYIWGLLNEGEEAQNALDLIYRFYDETGSTFRKIKSNQKTNLLLSGISEFEAEQLAHEFAILVAPDR